MQTVIRDSATAKGYTVTCEKVLDNGAIVDVHLENNQKKIGVEIAVFSTPEREVSHIKHCISFGYDQIYVIFSDENLLARTATAMREACSGQEASKVRLLPLSQLAQVG